jgi:hypothetical protein
MNTVGDRIPVRGTASGRSQILERYASRRIIANITLSGPQDPSKKNENRGDL